MPVQLGSRRPECPRQRGRVRAGAIPLVLDTGPLVAALDASDHNHEACADLIAGSTEARVIPAPVLVEVAYFAAKIGPAVFPAVLDDVRNGAFTIADLQASDYDRAAQLLRQYGDLRVGFVDAAVLAVVERLREPRLATLDHRHFAVMRPQHIEALELLPAWSRDR